MGRVLSLLNSLLLMSCADAATYFPPDDDFIRRAETLGVSQAMWDRAEYAAISFPHAYRFTSYYRISSDKPGSQVRPETWQPGASLDLAGLRGQDADADHDLLTLLRDRLKNHAMVVLQHNRLVHQHFFNGMDEHSTHLDMSVTKSFTAILAAIAVAEKKLDMSRRVDDYLPELRGTALEGATVQEVADMQSGLDIPTPEFMSWDPRMTHAQNWNGKNDAGLHGVMAYIQLIDKRNYAPGEVYQYQDPNSEVLGMVVEKATGENLADYLEDKLWQRIGAEQDALWMSGPDGFVVASGGLNMTTRDLARVGTVLLNNGKNYLGDQIIPRGFLDALWSGNDKVRAAWQRGAEAALAPEAWYKDQFRVVELGGYKLLVMIGIHGQVLVVEKSKGAVIAMNGGYPQTESPRLVNLIFYQVILSILNQLE